MEPAQTLREQFCRGEPPGRGFKTCNSCCAKATEGMPAATGAKVDVQGAAQARQRFKSQGSCQTAADTWNQQELVQHTRSAGKRHGVLHKGLRQMLPLAFLDCEGNSVGGAVGACCRALCLPGGSARGAVTGGGGAEVDAFS